MKRYFLSVLKSGRKYCITTGAVVSLVAGTVNAAVVYQINCGSNNAVAPFTSDQYGSGGTMRTVSDNIAISGITDPAPEAVYKSERYGNSTYTIPNLTASTQYNVRLHFAELYQTATGRRLFNVVINGITVLSNFDIYALTGARYKAVLREFLVTSNSSGQIVINFNTLTDNATIEGIEVHTISTVPTITTQPASQSINTGSPVTFSVVATGSPSPTYQWKKSGTNIGGATSASYTIASVQTGDEGSYTVTVTNGAGSVTSSVATLTVNTAPTITTQPVSQTAIVGSPVTFTVSATGSPSPTYQWGKDGTSISDATSASYTISSVQTADTGSYAVTVTNVAGNVTSTAATLTVNTAPTITTQPVSQAVTSGSPVTFTVSATGSPAPTYQWKKNGTNISDATSASYTISSVQTADTGSYAVTVSNVAGNVTSTAASLTVNTAPAITTQPLSQTVTSGSPVTFSVVATGIPAPTYQWQKGGTDISGATSTSYTIPSAQTTDVDLYTVMVMNAVGSVTSSAATLTVNTVPTITSQPVSQTVNEDSPVTFSVVATGTPSPTYQWKKGGTNIGGATGASYTISSVQTADAGSYTVTAMNVAGSVTSSVATLTVNTAPTITSQPVSQTVNEDSPVTFSVVATGIPTPNYQWKKGGAEIGGATSANYTISTVQVTDAGLYTVTVTNTVGSVTSTAATLTVNTAPTITTQPVSQTVAAGSPVTFTVAATGSPAPTYQWSKGGTNISGATSANYTISNVQPTDAGSFSVTVTNAAGSVTSTTATLMVNTSPIITTQPVSQTVTAGFPVTFSVAAAGSPSPTYQWQKGGADIGGATSASYTISTVQTTDADSYTVTVTNIIGSVTSAAAILTVNNLPTITTHPASQVVNEGSPVTFSVAATGNPLPTYQWQKGGTDISGATSASYTISTVQTTDAGLFTVEVTNVAGSVTSNAATLTVNTAPTITTHPVAQTVNENSPVTFSVLATGSPVPTYQWKKGGIDIIGTTSSSYTISSAQITDEGTYTVTVTNPLGSITSNAANLTVNLATPVITTQPSNQTVTEGQTATFSIATTGTNLSYQWQKNGTNISGATNSSYTTPITTVSDDGALYSCVVTNTGGSVTSSDATLTVNYAAPVITQQPQSQSVIEGSTATFSITATSMSGTLTYQWSKNGINIPGANSSTYTTPVTILSDSGAQYSCVVTNPPGTDSAISNNVLLEVTEVQVPPTITVQPANQSVYTGQTAQFSITAIGTQPLVYQWQKEGTDISGATSFSYTTPATTLADNTTHFSCVVTNSYGTVTSSSATLTVSNAPLVYAYPDVCGQNENMKVDGQIKCNSLLIHNWLLSQTGAPKTPDYVFDKAYSLPSLVEIEKYIKANGHLPEVPSASELESNGVDMIQLNFILLKKIEEMTLHLIRQEKEIEAMKKAMK